MELDFLQIAIEFNHHGYLLVTHLSMQKHCCRTSCHEYRYVNVMRSSRLFRGGGGIFEEWFQINDLEMSLGIVSDVIRSNY